VLACTIDEGANDVIAYDCIQYALDLLQHSFAYIPTAYQSAENGGNLHTQKRCLEMLSDLDVSFGRFFGYRC
jgi:hypothetical protein